MPEYVVRLGGDAVVGADVGPRVTCWPLAMIVLGVVIWSAMVAVMAGVPGGPHCRPWLSHEM